MESLPPLPVPKEESADVPLLPPVEQPGDVEKVAAKEESADVPPPLPPACSLAAPGALLNSVWKL